MPLSTNRLTYIRKTTTITHWDKSSVTVMQRNSVDYQLSIYHYKRLDDNPSQQASSAYGISLIPCVRPRHIVPRTMVERKVLDKREYVITAVR